MAARNHHKDNPMNSAASGAVGNLSLELRHPENQTPCVGDDASVGLDHAGAGFIRGSRSIHPH